MPSLRSEIKTALQTIMREDKKIILIGQSIRDPYGGAAKVTRGMTKEFDDRIIDTPICESAMIGMAIGLAMQGYKPIVEIMFSDFLTLCTMQIRQVAGILYEHHGVPMKIIIRTMYNSDEDYGPSHSECPHDILIFLSETERGDYNVVDCHYMDVKGLSPQQSIIDRYNAMLLNDIPIHIIVELKEDYGKEIK